MASAANPLPPPPGQDANTPSAPPTSPMAASPAPAQDSGGSNTSTQLVIGIIKGLRSLSKMIPGAAPGVAKINDIFQSEVMPQVMKGQSPGEPAAPPNAG